MSMSTVRSVRHPAAPARCFRSAITQGLRTRRAVSSAAVDTVQPTAVADPPITLTDKALSHLKKLKSENANPGSLLLRVGVKQGGCSGMSYLMDFEERDKVSADDMVAQYDQGNLELVIDPKSLLYLFGLHLDYSDALIGGGFKFQNPNATDSCGCGKSFGV
ncbi:iron-sulfur cluster assembly protein [Haematococcus lacustris]